MLVLRCSFLVVGLGACVSSTESFHRVTIDGTVTALDEDPSPVWLEVHHAWVGDGALRYPMGFIAERAQDAPGSFTWTLDVPMDEGGEGLVLYGWQDRDGDGVLCGLGGSVEPSGVEEAGAWPVYALTMDLVLEHDCAGPEALYP